MSEVSRPARLRTVLGWPTGIAVVCWRYMWRTTPLHRSEETGTPSDLPDPASEGSQPGHDRQPASAGVGPLMHRTYSVDIAGTGMAPESLINKVAECLNQATPEMAVFRKSESAGHQPVSYGDEFVVRMPGPWDGPVRVIKRDPAAFRLGTLQGHLEAGEIEFRAACHDDLLRFEIESWARAGDRVSNLLYNKVRLAKEIQLNMWTHLCIRAAALAGGRLRGGVTIRTRWVPWPDGAPAQR
jgi:hypothetical protein